MVTIFNALKIATSDLENYSDTAKLDARVLLKETIKKDDLFILINKDYEISEKLYNSYREKIDLRKKYMPIAYIIGRKEFMGFDFKVTKDTLIPRPDTEILVNETIKIIKANKAKSILDLACGSGAIGISIAKILPKTRVTLSDISNEALSISKENAANLDAKNIDKFIHSDLFNKIKGKFDIIVSNPPYIDEKEMDILMPDVRKYEPKSALFGGKDGLNFYKNIIKDSKNYLEKEGFLILEIGYNQSSEVKKLMKENGYKNIKIIKDLSNKDRVVIGKFRPET